MPLWIQETYVDADRRQIYGQTAPYETFTDSRKRLFQHLQREYGRCVSKMYAEPDARPVGWVFVKRVEYDGSSNTYLRETWIEITKETE